MEFEWDDAKRLATLSDRGLDFADLPEHFDWDTALYVEDFIREEIRTQTIGYLYDTVVVVIFTMRGERCRIISLRRADPRERRAYER